MESGIQSSFIPQDANKPTAVARPVASNGGLSELGLLISIVLFVASAALAGAVFLYGQYAQSSADSKVQQLQHAKDAFEPSLINQITRLDDRMRAADAILSAHVAPLAIFDALQAATLSTVSFSRLTYSGFDAQNMTLKMEGVAQSVNSIALQADLFSKDGVVTNPIFSDITRDTDGVHFTLTASVNPATVNYAKIAGTPVQQSPATQTQTATPSSQSSPFGQPANVQTQTQTQGTTTDAVAPTTTGTTPGLPGATQ